jgi:predicted metal-dependent HD superfamily phosphohydrolase
MDLSELEQIKHSIFANNGDYIEYTPATNSNMTSTMSISDTMHRQQRTQSTHDYLNLLWREATSHLSLANDQQTNKLTYFQDWFQKLWELHSTYTSRHYHTVVHLEEMCYYLQLVNTNYPILKPILNETINECSYQIKLSIKSILLLSIFFHDAIYDPQSSKNEEDSAELFASFARSTNLCVQHIDLIVSYILATKNHTIERSDISHTKGIDTNQQQPLDPLELFLDLDMSVLGKEPHAYQKYSALIRQEYHFVPKETYCTKRAEILEHFLKSSIYYTPIFYIAFDERARNNLSQEIQSLRQGTIPLLG